MKTVNMTHLARYTAVGGKRSLKERIRDLFSPADRRMEAFMQQAGMLLPAATYNYKGGYPAGTNTGMPAAGFALAMADIKLDFAAITAARLAAGQTALAFTDVLQLFELPAGTWVVAVFGQVSTVGTASATAGVGDGTATSGYFATLALDALGWGSSLATASLSVAVGGGKLYTATDTVDVILNTATPIIGVLSLRAVLCDVRGYRT